MDLNVMMTKATTGDSSSQSKITENGVVSPVLDNNLCSSVKINQGKKMKIEVTVPRLIDGDANDKNKLKIQVPIPKNLLFSSLGTETTSFYPDHAKLLVNNYENFKKSDKPVRFMYYSNGIWVNFEKNVMDVMVDGFVSGKPVIEVEMEGVKSLFDFYRMLEIDLGSGIERSISWIDVNGKCFFPKMFIDDSENVDGLNVGGNVNPKIEIEIRISDNELDKEAKEEAVKLGKRKRENELEEEGGSSSNVKEQEQERRVVTVGSEMPSSRWPKVRLMKEDEKGYRVVKAVFLSGMKVVDPDVAVNGVYQCVRTGMFEQARLEVFLKNMEIMKNARGGNANVVYAWFGTSAKNVELILRYGFGLTSVVRGSNSHGIGFGRGIYLSPIRLPQNSAMMSEVDESGERHIILCRVILGKLEKVELGSQQMYPSSVEFDTGVDDLKNPKCYVVWCANMNTHILPECVVSYKSGRLMSAVNWAPRASSALATLISKLTSSLPPPKVQELQSLYGSYREGQVGKEIFMRQLRSVVGDEMLRSTILEIRG